MYFFKEAEMEKLFKLQERGTTVRKEIAAGVTTFVTMAYILAVNPSILAETGMDPTAVMLATCLASFIGTMMMAIFANLPFALSAGMGLNAYFTYTVVFQYGYSWQIALLAVFTEGIIFILLSLTNVREAIFNCIPLVLKKSVSIGIGIFIAFIGLQNAKLCVSSATLVSLVDFKGNFATIGVTAMMAVIGLFIMIILYLKKVPGAILWGILLTWLFGILFEVLGVYQPDPENGFQSIIPTLHLPNFATMGETFGQCFHVNLKDVGVTNFIVVILAFLFVDLFDTLGTLIGVSSKANMLDENGKLPGIKPALLADAVATTAGAVMGTSTTTTFVESAAGVGAGGRTGLTAAVTAVLFLISTLFSSVFTAIPPFATAPALILVGFLMFSSISELKMDEENYTDAIPAYLCIISMPLFYSISDGIAIGVISYVFINAVCGKAKKISPLMYVLAVLFLLKYTIL